MNPFARKFVRTRRISEVFKLILFMFYVHRVCRADRRSALTHSAVLRSDLAYFQRMNIAVLSDMQKEARSGVKLKL